MSSSDKDEIDQYELEPDDNVFGAEVVQGGDDPFLDSDPGPDLGMFGPLDPSAPVARVRIVVLGRRRAGKTIFLARLYESAWNGKFSDLHMRALPGPGNAHETFMEIAARLRRGEWPESTIGSTSTPVDVEYKGETHLLIALDYPGEVFRRAFVHDSQEEAALELREHVDRAAAVILLLDPQVAMDGKVEEQVDDDYGMAEAIRRIRESHDGADVPIAIVLTKCDLHSELIKEQGGLRKFVESKYSNIMRVASKPRSRFPASAVRASKASDGTLVPNLVHEPVNIMEPMVYCIDHMARKIRKESAKEAAAAFASSQAAMQQIEETEERQTAIKWSIIGVLSVLLFGLIALILYLVIVPK